MVVLASDIEGKVNLIAMATETAMQKGAHAGNLIKGIAGFVGGGGGGRPNMAQAGGKNPAGIPGGGKGNGPCFGGSVILKLKKLKKHFQKIVDG